ncbi:MAG: hypothetical protein HN742_07475 [Lentisphaerae bacterium]|nr:hypothetical protein [Lentisphaerota bacterium]MBT4814143.1 hypothetical protein [Lentisphaerota bacterium]MBT5607368.1 hypothetical protein [Lentisphaerota bacterium]MBT7058378.1 hypothetical protein [Lentisphaerota bacterium]MBT7841695.1 hypothetical protein [Lentisphaerota bacterium]
MMRCDRQVRRWGWRVTVLVLCAHGVCSAASGPRLRVLKNGEEVLIRWPFSPDRDVVLRMAKGTNRQISFSHVRLVPGATPLTVAGVKAGTLVHAPGDDCTPWNLNGTYIGANHGCSDSRQIHSPGHGRTTIDLGTEWTDGKGDVFVLVKVVDADRLWFLSRDVGKGAIWRHVKKLDGERLTRTADGAHIPLSACKMVQLTPACRITKQDYLVDGKRPLEDGSVVACSFLDIVEEYDVINPASVVRDMVAHPGELRSFTAKHLDGVVSNRIVHRFSPNGAMVLDYSAEALQSFRIGYMGFIQAAKLYRGTYATHEYYIPKTLPFTVGENSYDFLGLQDYAPKLPKPLRFGPSFKNVADPASLPDRFVQLLGRREGDQVVRDVGFAMGYSLTEGLGKPGQRAGNAGAAAMLYSSSKSYPTAVDRKMGPTIEAGTRFHCVAYRQYFWPGHCPASTCVYWNRQGNSDIVYVDYHRMVERDTIRLPSEFVGRPVSVIEKTESVTLHTGDRVPTEGVLVSVSGDYGSLVLQIPVAAPAAQ